MTEHRLNVILSNARLGSLPFAFPRPFEMNGGAICSVGITPEEDREIRAVWETMSGDSCYFSALLRLGRTCELPGR